MESTGRVTRTTASPTVARPVRPNAAIQIRYAKRMKSILREMATSVETWVEQQRKDVPPEMAMDATPSQQMAAELQTIAERWQNQFDQMGPIIAEEFLRNQFKATDSAMRQALLAAGWAIEFTMTPPVRDAFEASLAENVGLIRSIPQQYLREVEGIVMRNYAAGQNMREMVREIKARYAVSAHRAVFIARDQTFKANSVVTRARQQELGIKEAQWLHSHAGREPRPTHVAMDGKRYKVDKGMYDSSVKKWIYPGWLPNCRCVCRSVLPWMPSEQETQTKNQQAGRSQ